MNKKIYTGTVAGFKTLANGNYLLFVECDRHFVDEGVGFDVVYSKSCVPLLHSVSYKIIRSERGFICVA